MNMQLFRPLSKGQSFALKFKIDAARRVVHLLMLGSPTAIFGAIPSVVIDALYRIPRPWFCAHVIEEIFKTMSPTFTNRYAARAIILKTWLVWILATRNHGAPRFVLWGVGFAMRRISSNRCFDLQATATLGRAIEQATPANCAILTTIASTQPHGFLPLIGANKSNHEQLTKDHACQVLNAGSADGNNWRQFFGVAIVGDCREWNLWDMIGVHQNLQFWCQAQDVCRVAGQSVLAYYSSILAQMSRVFRVSPLTDKAVACG